jgi:capsular polysaccharide transport system permease protein
LPATALPPLSAVPAPATRRLPSSPPRLLQRWLASARALARNLLFWCTVVVPTLLSSLYFGLVASDVYIAESKFVVRMPQRQSSPSLMGALLQGSAFMRSQDDTFTVHEYMLSRDALHALERSLPLRDAFGSAQIDRLNRFPAPWGDASFESLYRYYDHRVAVSFDAATSISTLRVTAFTADDAQAINERLLALGEARVNEINTRGRNDLIRYAQAEVEQAETRAKDAAAALAEFRNQRAVFDPERQSGLQLQSVSRLQDELTIARSQLAQVQSAAPQNPQLPSLRLRVQQSETALGAATAQVTGGHGSLTTKAADYERVALERAFADRQLAGALAALETARNEAQRQQLYLERVVLPNRPDKALEPRRLRTVVATLLVGLLAWGILSLLLSAVREHRH